MAAALEYPFTMAQWKELERQAMIYKYMMASVPVPHHLLSPLPSLPDPSASAAVSLSPHYGAGGAGDPETGRCRRTDGKKWRCAKAVAPNQKYCERHLNRGRSRSRKPVESLNSKPRLQHHRHLPLPSTTTSTAKVDLPSNSIPLSSPFLKSVFHSYHCQEPPPSSSLALPTIYSASSFKDPRWV